MAKRRPDRPGDVYFDYWPTRTPVLDRSQGAVLWRLFGRLLGRALLRSSTSLLGAVGRLRERR